MLDGLFGGGAKKDAAAAGSGSGPGAGRARVPPGQKHVKGFPVLSYGDTPRIDPAEWRLRVFGLVATEIVLGWSDLLAMPQARVPSDFHCVTRWSRLDIAWEGVLARDVLARAKPLPEARFVMAHGAGSEGGYTTNVPLAALLDSNVLIAHRHDGIALEPDHGGPVRLVVPKLYGWKSAKWLTGLELMAEDRPGFWEERGYSMSADPWKEERFRARD